MKWVLFLVGVLVVVANGCEVTTVTINNTESLKEEVVKPSIRNISLGASKDDVLKQFGHYYKEAYIKSKSYYGEEIYIWEYEEGVSFIIGRQSGEVLEITTDNPVMLTNMKVHVGTYAKDVFDIFDGEYNEIINPKTEDKLVGWFNINDTIMILDFDPSDGYKNFGELKDKDQVKRIKLTKYNNLEVLF